MLSSVSPESSAPLKEREKIDFNEHLDKEESSPPASRSDRDEAAKTFTKLGAEIALAGVKAAQSNKGNTNKNKVDSVGDIVLGIVLPIILIAIVIASLVIVLNPDSFHNQKLVEAASGQLFALPGMIMTYLIGRHSARSG